MVRAKALPRSHVEKHQDSEMPPRRVTDTHTCISASCFRMLPKRAIIVSDRASDSKFTEFCSDTAIRRGREARRAIACA
jgi:hypothetical protein